MQYLSVAAQSLSQFVSLPLFNDIEEGGGGNKVRFDMTEQVSWGRHGREVGEEHRGNNDKHSAWQFCASPSSLIGVWLSVKLSGCRIECQTDSYYSYWIRFSKNMITFKALTSFHLSVTARGTSVEGVRVKEKKIKLFTLADCMYRMNGQWLLSTWHIIWSGEHVP